jgi:hypothetical protein
MDGIEIDEVCRSSMNRFAEGHITMEEMGIAIDIHARALVAEAQRRQAAGELQDSPYTNYVAVEEDAEIQEVVFPDGRRRWFFIDEAKRIS